MAHKLRYKVGDEVLLLTKVVGKTVYVQATIVEVIPPDRYTVSYTKKDESGDDVSCLETVGEPRLKDKS